MEEVSGHKLVTAVTSFTRGGISSFLDSVTSPSRHSLQSHPLVLRKMMRCVLCPCHSSDCLWSVCHERLSTSDNNGVDKQKRASRASTRFTRTRKTQSDRETDRSSGEGGGGGGGE